MNHRQSMISLNYSVLLLAIILLSCTTIEQTLSYQLIPQRARRLFQQSNSNNNNGGHHHQHQRQRRAFQRSFRNLDEEDDTVASDTYNSKSLHLGLVGLKLQALARKRRYYSLKNLAKFKALTAATAATTTTTSNKKTIANNVHHLRQAVLDEQKELRKIRIEDYVQEQTAAIADHEVLQLLQERFETYSTPGNRNDNATLALAMEGGGMRGCVSAGMAAAIASLGLTEAFDAVYGSSAGSVVGAYMISRQMCVDVYVDILPAAKKKFVCKKRLIRSIAANLADVMVSGIKRSSKSSWKDKQTVASDASVSNVNNNNNNSGESDSVKPVETTTTPGMNISYVLDGIMDRRHGLRPLDLEKFQENDKKQRLRVVSSTVDEKGNLVSKVFGTEDFFHSNNMQMKQTGDRQGLFACLQASMTVPGATGPPVRLHRSKDHENQDKVLPCFDAFCFEPIPYRSAVEEGATHVLALCTRPEGCELKTKPGMYEQGVAPLYFKSHGLGKVGKYFEQGGQQYIYAEDILTLEEGKMSKFDKVLVPPPKVYHGTELSAQDQMEIKNREQEWKKAHLMPIKVPQSISELSTLEQDKDAVLEAVRSGFAAAFDILAPIVGVDLDMTGVEASRLVFPSKQSPEDESADAAADMELEEQRVLNTQLLVPGLSIPDFKVSTDARDPVPRRRKRERIRSMVLRIVKWKRKNQQGTVPTVVSAVAMDQSPPLDAPLSSAVRTSSESAETLLKSLPGLNGDRALFQHLSKDLRSSVYGKETTA